MCPSSKVEVQAIGAVLGAAPIAERARPTRPGGACAPSGPKEKKGPDGATARGRAIAALGRAGILQAAFPSRLDSSAARSRSRVRLPGLDEEAASVVEAEIVGLAVRLQTGLGERRIWLTEA